jgi:hypothetical protein
MARGTSRSFSPDGRLLAGVVAAERRPSLCVWDTAAGAVLAILPGVEGHHWTSDGRRLIGYTLLRVAWWEVTRPVPTYELGKPVQSLALNRPGDRLAANDYVCAVAGGERGPELVRWDASLRGLSPLFVGKDELWALRQVDRYQGGWPFSVPKVTGLSLVGLLAAPGGAGPLPACAALAPPPRRYETELWQRAPRRRKLVLPTVAYPEYVKRFQGEAERYGSLGPRLRLDSVRTERWAVAPEAPLLLREGVVTFLSRPGGEDFSRRDARSSSYGIIRRANELKSWAGPAGVSGSARTAGVSPSPGKANWRCGARPPVRSSGRCGTGGVASGPSG